MAAGDTPITIVGNLVNDPELRFTNSGQPVAQFRIASTPRLRDNATGEWKDGDSLFLTCNVWRQMAENVAESLQRGMRVIVSGRLRQRNYETAQGEKRTVYEVEVDDVGPSLLRASAKVNRVTRTGGDGSGFGGNSGGGSSGQQRAGGSSGGNSGGTWSGGGNSAGGNSSGGSSSGGSSSSGSASGGSPSGGSRESDPWAADSAGYSDEPPF
jgi:single-strand DNA-binding protein